jgi:hypothetical protein
MPVVFSGNAGRVSFVNDESAQGTISLGEIVGNPSAGTTSSTHPLSAGATLSFTNHKTIITRIGISTSGNFQFLHTMGNDVFVYVFGDRMGDITLHGLCFADDCSSPTPPHGVTNLGGTAQPGQKHGFELLYDWYLNSRMSVNASPVTVTIGQGTVFKGFITGLTGDVKDAMTRTIQYQITVSMLPPTLN